MGKPEVVVIIIFCKMSCFLKSESCLVYEFVVLLNNLLAFVLCSFKRKSEPLFSHVKKKPCVWKNQKPDAESMDEEIIQTNETENRSSEQIKQERPSRADNAGNTSQRFFASLSRTSSIPSTQTMIVPPLTRTEMPLPPDESDQAGNLQKLTGLEREVQRLRQILGLQITKKNQGTMTTADFSAEKPKEGLLIPPGSSSEVGCQTEVTEAIIILLLLYLYAFRAARWCRNVHIHASYMLNFI